MLATVVQDILDDFQTEDGGSHLIESQATRYAQRALAILGLDLGIGYVIDGDDVSPEMPESHREIWIMRAKVMACAHLRARSAGNYSWKSGDESMDRREEAKRWADLAAALIDEYETAVHSINPDYDSDEVTASGIGLLAERGSRG